MSIWVIKILPPPITQLFPLGVCGGIISVTSFAALVAIYPHRVATVTALAETVLNGALAVGPFVGRNRANQEILLPDWLITSHVT